MLYVVGTPIGNLADLSLRQAKLITSSDVILAEDTRNAQKLLHYIQTNFKLEKKTELHIISYYKEVEFQKLPNIINLLEEDKEVALISDSGMPIVSDPGQLLIQHVIKKNIKFTVIPGPSAVNTSFVHSGFKGDAFSFLGFLPKKNKDMSKFFNSILNQLSFIKNSKINATNIKKGNTSFVNIFIFYESPKRITKTIKLMKNIFPKETQIAICREMTKIHEEIIRGNIEEVYANIQGRDLKGEISVVMQI